MWRQWWRAVANTNKPVYVVELDTLMALVLINVMWIKHSGSCVMAPLEPLSTLRNPGDSQKARRRWAQVMMAAGDHPCLNDRVIFPNQRRARH